MIGWRIRVVNEDDEEAQIKTGRKRLGSKASSAKVNEKATVASSSDRDMMIEISTTLRRALQR